MPSDSDANHTGLTRRGFLAASAGVAAATVPRLAFAETSGEILWGASLPLSGSFAHAGEQNQQGLRAFADYLNANGGIEGRRVRVEVRDSGYRPERAAAAFNELVSGKPGAVAHLGDSTGFAHKVTPALNEHRKAIVASTSFASELADTEKHPLQFLPGPTYADMVRLLITYLASVRPGGSRDYRLVLVHSNTEYGRDPLEAASAEAKAKGLSLVDVVQTKVAGADTGPVVERLADAKPNAVIFHGYIGSVWPDVIRESSAAGIEALYLGTFWAMEPGMLAGLGPLARRYFGVVPYRYYWERADAPMLAAIAMQTGAGDLSSHFIQAWLVGMIFAEAIRRTLGAGQPLSGDHLMAALNSLEDWDTGGLIGAPVRFVNNRIPLGRIYRGNPEAGRFEPASDWLRA